MLRVHAQIDGQFNGLVELGVMRLFQKLGGIGELVRTRFHFLARILHVFSSLLGHSFYLYDLVAPELLGFHDFQAHVARRTHHGAHRGLQIGGVEIDKLDLRNFLDLLFRYFADFVAVRFRGTLRDIRRALEQHRSRRRLQNKRERAVGVNRHEHRKNHPVRFLRGLGVELLAEIHDVQAMWAERSADRRRRSGFARGQLQLDGGLNLLCHVPASISFCFRALRGLSQLFDARKIQLDRSRASKNRHRNLQTAVIVVDLFDVAVEVRKRAIHDAHLLVALENHFRFRAVLRRMYAVDNAVHFRLGQRRRRRGRADEAGDPRRGPHDVPGVFIEVHLDQHVAGIRHPRGNHLFAAADFDHFLHGDQHAADLVLKVEGLHAALETLFYFLLEARVGMDDVPLHSHRSSVPFQTPNLFRTYATPSCTSLSTTSRNTPKNATVAMTTQVVETTSSRLGQVTCFISTRTSCKNSRALSTVPVTLFPSSEPIPPCDSPFFTLTACVAMNPRSIL